MARPCIALQLEAEADLGQPTGKASLTGLLLQNLEFAGGTDLDATEVHTISSVSKVVCSLQQIDPSLDDTAHQEGYSATVALPLLVDVSGFQGEDYH